MRASRFTVVAAPLGIAAYGVARLVGKQDGQYGPGLDWQVAHLLALAGMVLFVPALLLLRGLLPVSRWRTAAFTVTLVGLAAAVVQFGADVVEAALAADKAELQSLSQRFTDIPGVTPVFYTVGPQLFFVGLIAVAVLLATAKRLPWWSPVLLTVGVLLPPFTLDLLPLAGLLIAAALAPAVLGRTAGVSAAAHP